MLDRRLKSAVVAALLAFIASVAPRATIAAEAILSPSGFAHHIEKFNTMEPEGVVNAVPNAEAWTWLQRNVPRFECADGEVEEMYWFRWWAVRKHLKRDTASGQWVFTEFITKPRPVSSALGHQFMEGRWLRDQSFHDGVAQYWLHGKQGAPQDHLHKYSQWTAYALWSRWLVTQDTPQLVAILDDLVADYRKWETERMRPDGLFWQADVWDAMEESISGGRKVKNVRPTLSCYMYGNATAIAAVARLAERGELAREFEGKAANLRTLVQTTLWDSELVFFGSVTEQLEKIKVREQIGFIPWYFNLPESGRGYEVAWNQFTDEAGFKAPFGITTAERRHPQFRSHGVGTCEWDGAVWPFASSQTLTGLANALQGSAPLPVTSRDYFEAFRTYVRSQHYDGLPYIGEYLDEKTGAWLKGRDPRSYYYNHSTFADLLITGVIGLRPRADDTIEIHPLLPPGTWAWFALDGVRYHRHELTILWDVEGKRYGRGRGLTLFVDGKRVAQRDNLEPFLAKLP